MSYQEIPTEVQINIKAKYIFTQGTLEKNKNRRKKTWGQVENRYDSIKFVNNDINAEDKNKMVFAAFCIAQEEEHPHKGLIPNA